MAFIESDSYKRTALAALALLVISAVVFFVVHGRRKRALKPMDFGDMKLTTVLAEESAKLLGPHGRVVIVAMDPVTIPGARAQIDDLTTAFTKFSSVTLLATETYRPDRSVPPRCTFPATLFFDVLQRHPRLDAIVSLIGAPDISEKELAQLGTDMPKVLIVSHCAANLKPLFETGLVHLAIIPSGHLPSTGKNKPTTAREKFNLLYRIITPPNANTLPD